MRCPASLVLALLVAACGGREELRVCADPNNLPFSNAAGGGFENRLVELVAADLGADVRYTWWAQRRGNVRETLKADRCDVIPGVGAGLEMLATTRPYYNSTYVAVTRADRDLAIGSFDDPRLRDLRIGVQMIGDDFRQHAPRPRPRSPRPGRKRPRLHDLRRLQPPRAPGRDRPRRRRR